VQPVATPVPAARPAASAASVADVPLEAAYRAAPSPSLEAPPPVPTHALDAEPVRSAPPPARVPHRVPFALLAAWLKPGMCGSSSDANAVRATLTANFREVSPDEGGTLYLDPRLPVEAGQPILQALRLTEYEIGERLELRPPRPSIYVYADQPLMKAAACVNEDVVAFYDGALHLVANRTDLQSSLSHEYTHHALFSAGLIAPAWAQEGIAMNVAKERWWQDDRYLNGLFASPFSLEQMDHTIPYKLPSQQAVVFYVQSAALVECLLQARKWTLKELFSALKAGASTDSLTYDLAELEQSGFLPSCLHGLH
jgi:hypothetical protein